MPLPPPADLWDGKRPHEHIYDALEIILAAIQELERQVQELRRQVEEANHKLATIER
jgi:cell division septum initiation protein DivIVA